MDNTGAIFRPRSSRRCVSPPSMRASCRARSSTSWRSSSKGMGAKGLARAKIDGQGESANWTQSPLAKTITPELRTRHQRRDRRERRRSPVLPVRKRESSVQTVMANLRTHLAKKLGLIPESRARREVQLLVGREPAALRVRRRAKRLGRGASRLHASARRLHVDLLDKDPGKVLCWRYDLGAQRIRDRRRVHSSP